MSIPLATKLTTRFEDAVARTREALAQHGFGVLTEIDVKATVKTKLGVDMEDYLILGACNPALAHRAISADREIGPSTSLPRLPDFRLRRGPLVRESEGTFHRPCLPINHASSYRGSAKFGGGDVNRPRAADDFATIRARMEELRRERAQEAKTETREPADRAVETRGLLRRLEGRQRPEPEASPTGSASRRYGSGR